MRIAILISILVLSAGACSEDEEPDGYTGASDSDSDVDSDVDTDADSDADTDADSDADSDSDTDTDTDADVWQPAPGTTWQWQLTGDIDTDVDVQMFDIDLFDAPQSVIDALHSAGRIVICYFSAGSYEEWRPDADEFPSAAIGNPLEGWPGEAWIDTTDGTIREIMAARLDLAVDKECDGVEPDNVDGYANDNGLGLTYAEQLDYNVFLADEAHNRDLSVGLKNDLDQVDDLNHLFDWALNEECMAWDECDVLDPFLDDGKTVFHVEYVDDEADGPDLAAAICDDPAIDGFSTLVKTWDLDAWRIACE